MLSPSRHGGPQARVSSPLPGRSTLITSAPRSPSSIDAYGPARTREKSATIRPSSGAGIGRQTTSPCGRWSSPTCTSARARRPTCCAAPSCASRWWRRVRGVDRLVILGDGLELRDGPHRDAVALAGPFFADIGRALGADGELLLCCRQPRPRARGGVDRRAAADRAVRLPRARAAHRAARRRPAGGRARRARGAGARRGRLPRRLAARGRLRDPRPLLGPARDRADVRAARRRRDGALGRRAARATARRRTTTRPSCRRCTRGCTRSPSAPTTRS